MSSLVDLRQLPVVLELVLQPCQLSYDFLAFGNDFWVCRSSCGTVDIINALGLGIISN
jgi:hypothetical protein